MAKAKDTGPEAKAMAIVAGAKAIKFGLEVP